MPNSSISSVKLPSGSPYDLRDKYSEHYLGKVTSGSVGDGTAISGNYTINGETVAASDIKENDVVVDSNIHQYIAKNVSGTMTWVKITPTAATPGNGTITIQRNSSTIDTFTVNQTSNTSIDIEVPVLGVSVNGTAITPDSNKVADITSIPASIIASGELTNGMTATTQTSTDNSKKLATTAFVQTVVTNQLAQTMVFKGTVGTGGDYETLPTTGVKIGDTYKVFVNGTYAGQAAKEGDIFIAKTTTPTWSYIPSGDEPSGTVTSVSITSNKGLVVSDSGTSSTTSITTAGTIGLSFANTGGALSDGTNVTTGTSPNIVNHVVTPVGLDSSNNLAVEFAVDNAYNSSTNKIATTTGVSNAVTAAIENLDGVITNTPGAAKTITAFSQTDGVVSATFENISLPIGQVTGTTTTTINHFTSNPGSVIKTISTTSTTGASELTYMHMDQTDSECLVFEKIYTTTAATGAVSNVLKKS